MFLDSLDLNHGSNVKKKNTTQSLNREVDHTDR